MSSTSTVRSRRRPPAGLGAALAAAAFTLAIALASPATAQDADPVVARVNGAEIRAGDLAIIEEELGPNLPAMAPGAKRDYLIALMTDTLLVAQAARNQGLGDTADMKRRLAFASTRLLSEALLQQEAKAAVTEAALRKVYGEAVAQIGPQEEVRARHILFRVENADDKAASKQAEDKIKAVIARLKAGEDFAKLAGELTEDPSGKDNGGDLGYFTREQMVPEFSEVAFKLPVGGVSEPLKTQFGWHVLKVEDKRAKAPPTFEQVRDQLENFVVRKAQSELIAKLRAAAKIERVGEPAPSAPAGAAPKAQ